MGSEADEARSLHDDAKGLMPMRHGSNAIEARLDKLTSMIERLSKTKQPLDSLERQLLSQTTGVAQSSQGNVGKGNCKTLTSTSSPAPSPRRTGDSSGDEFPIPSGRATDLVDPVGSLNLGHLSLDDSGRSRYVAMSFGRVRRSLIATAQICWDDVLGLDISRGMANRRENGGARC